MGNESSRRSGSRQSSLDDPPYATATQPIGDSPRRLLKTQSLSTPRRSLQRSSPKSSSLRHSIVTVHEAVDEDDTLAKDSAYLEMQAVPMFYPIIRDTIRNPVMKEINSSTKLDVQAAQNLVSKYQMVVRDNVEGVSRDQYHLTRRLEDMDYAISTLLQILQEKSRKLAKQTDQLNTISQLQALLNSSKVCMQRTEGTLRKLNECLPPEHRLEPLDLSVLARPELNDSAPN